MQNKKGRTITFRVDESAAEWAEGEMLVTIVQIVTKLL